MEFNTQFLTLIPLMPLAGALINGTVALKVSRDRLHNPAVKNPEMFSAFVGCLFPILSFALTVWAFLTLKALPEGEGKLATDAVLPWLSTPLINISFGFLFDHLSSVMTLVVTGVGSLIHIYSRGYMHDDEGFSRFFAYLNLFLFFMLLLVLGDNLLVLFVGWEGVGLCSYLLIGFWFTDAAKAQCGKKAFVANRVGDFGFLIGLFFIVFAFTSQAQSSDLRFFNYDFLAAHKEVLAPFATLITLCLFTGATGKSAQIPLYVWLPDAMAGPTPVSALIHAATMVTAGVYMVARLFFVYAMAPFTLHIIATIGLATAIGAALIAITQYDIKKVLAYSTVSQLGYMFLGLGVGAPQAAIFHVVTHAFFKACLFLGSGSVIYACHHEQDIRHMGGLLKKIPLTGFMFLLSTIAIAGIPPFAGFFSKDEILWHVYASGNTTYYVLALMAAGLTAFYMFRLFAYTFLGKFRGHEVHHVPASMNFPVLILGILAVVGGLMGIPEVLGGHNHFHHWLHELTAGLPALEGDHHTELMLMGVSAAWALLLSLISLALYSRNLEWTKNIKIKLKPLHNLMSNKFYIDELYNAVIIQPLKHISDALLWKVADVKLIDGIIVHGWGNLARFMAGVIVRVQSGLVAHYAILILISLIAMLYVVTK
ncbi:NADH-quinone oxidoreductase subunit L [bacterium]|nr:NADH-quinone oxidoreductase subunit L [bacterium]